MGTDTNWTVGFTVISETLRANDKQVHDSRDYLFTFLQEFRWI